LQNFLEGEFNIWISAWEWISVGPKRQQGPARPEKHRCKSGMPESTQLISPVTDSSASARVANPINFIVSL
jgi:hypothetical protein